MKKWKFGLAIGLILVIALVLRLYHLAALPPYWEEVALGYDAYSILQTGKDHHDNTWPIVAFESFGDWKPSLYFYTIIPFIKVLGLNVWAIRLPSVLSGVAIVGGMGLLTFLIGDHQQEKSKKQLALIAMAVATISPWALLFSRGGWEVNLATALILWGVVLGLLSQQQNKSSKKAFGLLLTSALLLVLSMYTYHAARIVAPFLGMIIGLLYLFSERVTIKQRLPSLVMVGIVAIVCLLPLIWSLGSQITNQRFAETSIFSEIKLIEESNTLKEATGNTWLARLFYHRYLIFGREIITNYLSHFRLDFLFVSGDANPRHSIQYFGQLYHLEFIFLLLGTYYLFRHRHKYHFFLLLWLLVGILPAAITKASPHALRLLPTLPVWLVLISYGVHGFVFEVADKVGQILTIKRQLLLTIISLLVVVTYLGEFAAFWRFYTKIYPIVQAHEWQFGYESLVNKLASSVQNYDLIYVTREYGRPAIYYWFYTVTDPHLVQAQAATTKQDQGEFLEYENLRFIRSVAEVHQTQALVASSENQYNQIKDRYQTRMVDTILDLRGNKIWLLYELE